MSSRPGKLFIVSAPSGTGKTTLVERLVQVVPRLKMSRSYTSRPARAGERDGVDYNFISRDRFDSMIAAGDFLEYADVFGNCYGTGRGDTEALLTEGDDVVLVIDVQGARQVRALCAGSVGIFVLPPSAATLERRLRGRSKDSEEQILRRLEVARQEVPEYGGYEYVVVNDELEPAVERLRAIVLAERTRVQSMRTTAEEIIGTFAKRGSVGKSTEAEQV
jgi:guanylate kinase